MYKKGFSLLYHVFFIFSNVHSKVRSLTKCAKNLSRLYKVTYHAV